MMLFEQVNILGVIFQFVFLGLIVLFVISFTLFIRRLLLNSKEKASDMNEVEKKLDKIIEILEKDKR
ncbi:DUF4083 domain-containing protein [Bacillus suaedae]|uniref:DUF4083 domain-containing protein n=1 Tax=Halalkalibacter suaedae TaxID=2822140 RepID=A0A940X0C2_9BACI|nr:DUF4083 domain-containing protein [Bacillus suaedae]MBP3952521.1 DUF4083 domain-containing protein [Bacillus suaedae]